MKLNRGLIRGALLLLYKNNIRRPGGIFTLSGFSALHLFPLQKIAYLW